MSYISRVFEVILVFKKALLEWFYAENESVNL